ncbi:MAG: spore coat associated protein CotJA [Bacillota bacterium]
MTNKEGLKLDDTRQLRLRLAEAYIPFQIYVNRWEPLKALAMGTVFPELYRPYHGTTDGWGRD